MAICIILARGGSKRIPKKNIRLMNGKPMISYPINAAKKSGIFDRVIVSTDSEEIKDTAVYYGAEVPRLRTGFPASDDATTLDAMSDELTALNVGPQELVCCLYACTPTVSPNELSIGKHCFDEGVLDYTNYFNYVFPVIKFPVPIERRLIRYPSGETEMHNPRFMNKTTGYFEPTYYDAGQWYFGRAESFINKVNILEKSWTLKVSANDVVDINTEEDWERAELILKIRDMK